MHKILLMISTASALFLSGCQSKSHDSKPSNSSPDKAPSATEVTTADLKAPTDMNFISHEEVSLLADISLKGGGPTYLSVYSDYKYSDINSTKQEEYKQWKINQNSRILASSMEASTSEYLISIPQHIERILVQVWFYDSRPAVSQEVVVQKELIIKF